MPRSDYQDALNHRYRVRSGEPTVPSVTTVIGIIDKPALKWAAAKIAAETAIDLIGTMEYDALVQHCRGEFNRVWNEKAKLGTRVHGVAEEWAKGSTVDVPASDQGFVDALEAFYRDLHPTTIMAERVVIHSALGYGGRFDAVMRIGESAFLVDFKTGGKYPRDVAMQAAAYLACDLAVYDETGTLVSSEPFEGLDGARILYLRSDGSYEFVDPFADIPGSLAFESFVHALNLYRTVKEMDGLSKEKK